MEEELNEIQRRIRGMMHQDELTNTQLAVEIIYLLELLKKILSTD